MAVWRKPPKNEVAKPGEAFLKAYPGSPIRTMPPEDVKELWQA